MSARPSQLKSSRRATPKRTPLKVVSRKKPRRLASTGKARRTAPVMIMGTIAILALVFGILLEQVVLAQSAFKLTKQRERLERAEELHESLLHTAAQLESPARIERVARKRLGMITPDASAVRYIVADVRQPGEGTDPSGGGSGIASAAEVPEPGTALGGDAP